jgi:hypothetical protein
LWREIQSALPLTGLDDGWRNELRNGSRLCEMFVNVLPTYGDFSSRPFVESLRRDPRLEALVQKLAPVGSK